MFGKAIKIGGMGVLALASATPAEAAVFYGPCRFNAETLRFAGTVAQTTACLLKKVRPKGSGADAQPVPAWLIDRVAQPFPFTAAQIDAYLRRKGIARATLSNRLAAGDAPRLRYFVIHDTSSPELTGDFPADINAGSWTGNRLTGWGSIADRVNLIVARDGGSRVLVPWGAVRARSATKLEQPNRAQTARPVFAHVENIQPRIKPAGSWAWKAPDPGLGAEQEQRLAVAYYVASLHAGRWLIPAYHFNIDQGFADVHDDPQNMDLTSWAGRLAAIEADIRGN